MKLHFIMLPKLSYYFFRFYRFTQPFFDVDFVPRFYYLTTVLHVLISRPKTTCKQERITYCE